MIEHSSNYGNKSYTLTDGTIMHISRLEMILFVIVLIIFLVAMLPFALVYTGYLKVKSLIRLVKKK